MYLALSSDMVEADGQSEATVGDRFAVPSEQRQLECIPTRIESEQWKDGEAGS